MMAFPLLWVALFLPLSAAAQESPMTGAGFEAFVQGRTMDTYDETGLFGVETFLPGRRTPGAMPTAA
jgi:hypothetical protein